MKSDFIGFILAILVQISGINTIVDTLTFTHI